LLINLKSLPFIWAAGLGVVALLWAASGLRQPLWVDELHSSWVIADDWADVTSRARLGNQTPGYFASLKCLVGICGTQTDWLIRLPSALAWGIAVASITWMLLQMNGPSQDRLSQELVGQPLAQRSDRRYLWQLAVVLWCSCVLLDPWQYFYAIEARVYSIVQLLNLWAWFVVVRLSIRYNQTNRWLWLAWASLASALLHLHITTGLGVIFQCAVLTLTAAWYGRDRVCCLTSQLFVGINAAWLLYDSQAIWQRRQQWATFAGDGSFPLLIELFPFVTLLLPVVTGWLVACGIEWLRNGGTLAFQSKANGKSLDTPPVLGTDRQNVRLESSRLQVCLWGIAALAPYLLAWILTRYDIAPMFHYRFVMVSALPLYLFAGSWWLQQTNLVIRFLTLCVVVCWMNSTQGPWAPQQTGRWQDERQEDWRSASKFVGQNYQSPTQSLWCYAGLIEGLGLKLPLTEDADEYLSYPLRGCYRISKNATTVTPHGLVADRRLWLQQIRSSATTSGKTIFSQKVWIFYRGEAERLTADLKSAGMHNFGQIVPIRQFGRVSVVCVQIDADR
jgi:hypothetical protein